MATHLRHLGWSFGAVLIATTAWADFGDPLPGLSQQQRARFDAGRDAFMEVENVADGLGPIFNEASCATCHTTPTGAVGGGSTRLETRFGRIVQTTFDDLANKGGSLLQDHAIGTGDASSALAATCGPNFSFSAETVPPNANVVALRRTTPLFGLGLVDAVPDQTLIALAAAEQQADPATAGTVSFVPDPDTHQTVVGRFGWKAQHGRLHAFSGDAYLNEMGITNPAFPIENCPNGDPSHCQVMNACNPVPALNDDGGDVTAFTDFMQLLDAPPPGSAPGSGAGKQTFESIGCAKCHTATLKTGSSPIAALSNKTFQPYSDFLLHDMGSLGDGITQNNATGRLMRTAPLWGARIQSTFLHDGRATTVRDAILAHDGQGAAAKAAFAALTETRKQQVLAFIMTL